MNMNLNIGIWNANGLQATAIDDILQYCDSLDILCITETWLLPPSRLPTTWVQHHLYGNPVQGHYRGSNGVTILVSPSTPFAVIPVPMNNRFCLAVRAGPITIICAY